MSKSPDKTAAVLAALADIDNKILPSAYAAAKKYGVAESSISRALKRRAHKCPTCGHPVKHV